MKSLTPDLIAGLREVCNESHTWCKEAGFYDIDTLLEQLAKLLVSEANALVEGNQLIEAGDILLPTVKAAMIAGEAHELVEAHRTGALEPCDKTPNLTAEEEECADIFLRLVDYCGYRGVDLGSAVALKHAVNVRRAEEKRAYGKNV